MVEQVDPPVATGRVLVHPDHDAGHPGACRIIARAVTRGEWPWVRLTGDPRAVPARGGDLDGWRPQALAELGRVLDPVAGRRDP